MSTHSYTVDCMTTRAPALPAEERRSAIIAAALPLFLERGVNVTSRQIAEAAGVAEGTLFAVFGDKQAIIRAAVEAALDPGPTDRAISAIDPGLPFEDQLAVAVAIMQHRLSNIWRLISSVGDVGAVSHTPANFPALAALFAANRSLVRGDPERASQQLRALTLALSHPALSPGDPMTPREIVELLLDGIRLPVARSEGGPAR